MSSLGGRVCLTCTHPQREQIDTDLVSGVSVAAASRRYGIGDDSMAPAQEAAPAEAPTGCTRRRRGC